MQRSEAVELIYRAGAAGHGRNVLVMPSRGQALPEDRVVPPHQVLGDDDLLNLRGTFVQA